jgi:hypothetical protein
MKARAFLHKEGIYAQARRPDPILLDLNMPKRMDVKEILIRDGHIAPER